MHAQPQVMGLAIVGEWQGVWNPCASVSMFEKKILAERMRNMKEAKEFQSGAKLSQFL